MGDVDALGDNHRARGYVSCRIGTSANVGLYCREFKLSTAAVYWLPMSQMTRMDQRTLLFNLLTLAVTFMVGFMAGYWVVQQVLALIFGVPEL